MQHRDDDVEKQPGGSPPTVSSGGIGEALATLVATLPPYLKPIGETLFSVWASVSNPGGPPPMHAIAGQIEQAIRLIPGPSVPSANLRAAVSTIFDDFDTLSRGDALDLIWQALGNPSLTQEQRLGRNGGES